MNQPDAVSRRLVDGIYKLELDGVVSRGIMSRDAAVECLLAAGCNLELVNRLWRAWRHTHPDQQRMARIAGQARLELELVAYVRLHARRHRDR